MIHTIYSNSYEVLRTVLLHNMAHLRFVDASGEALDAPALIASAFESVPVIIPSQAVEVDLKRSIAERDRVCAAMKFMYLSQWMGLYSKEPLANVVGNEAEWMIWRIFCETGPGSFRERVKAADPAGRLANYLNGKTEREIYAFSRHVAAVFVAYASYRADWVFSWLGIRPQQAESARAKAERAKLEASPDFGWQKALWQELAKCPGWRGREFLADFPEALEKLAAAPAGADRVNLGTEERRRWVQLPKALHIFAPFVVPPLMLPILRAFAQSGREVWLYLLNPCAEYWFDLMPRRLLAWKEVKSGGSEHYEIGHPLLADNGRSVRANIQRLWRFTQGPDTAAGLALSELDLGDEQRAADEFDSTREPGPLALEPASAFARFMANPSDVKVDMAVETQGYYLEAREDSLLRCIQDSILKLEPDLRRVMPEGKALVRADDESLRFVCAPTATRELEGLADWLQAQFAADPKLRLDDVLVVTPDISGMAPLIEKVFGSLVDRSGAQGERQLRIDFRITGTTKLESDAPAQALLELAKLITGRARRDEFIAWLTQPPVSARFGFSTEDVSILRVWLASAGYSCGILEEQLREQDSVTFAKVTDMTLERALERLALGFMLPEDEKLPWGDAAPAQGTALGGWTAVGDRPDLLEALSQIASGLSLLWREAHPSAGGGREAPERWLAWIGRAIELFFPREGASWDYSVIRGEAAALAAEIEAAGGGAEAPDALKPAGEGFVSDSAEAAAAMMPAALPAPEVSFALFFDGLEGRFEADPGSARPSNAVTFAGMQQLRGLPYKIIAVIGLSQDCSFPGTTRAEEFDLMAKAPRQGDRDSRRDNRNVFLDLLLAARKRFLISYVGGTNEAQPEEPSIIAQELREWILSFLQGEERRKAESLLTMRLPLNAFSAKNFSAAQGAWQSRSAELLEAVRAAAQASYEAPEAPFADAGFEPAAAAEQSVVPFQAVWSFWDNPSRWTLSSAGVRLPTDDDSPDCPMIPEKGGLSRWSRRQTAITALLAGTPLEEIRDVWAADPLQGGAGIREWASEDDLAFAQEAAAKHRSWSTGLAPAPEKSVRLALDASETPDGRPAVIAASFTHLLWDPLAKGRARTLHLPLCTPSKADGSPVLRLYAFYALARAAGWNVRAEIVCSDDKSVAPQQLSFQEIPADFARRFVKALYWGYARAKSAPAPIAAKGAPAWNQTVPAEDELVFRGRSLSEGERAKDAFIDVMKALAAAPDDNPKSKKKKTDIEEALAKLNAVAGCAAQGAAPQNLP